MKKTKKNFNILFPRKETQLDADYHSENCIFLTLIFKKDIKFFFNFYKKNK